EARAQLQRDRLHELQRHLFQHEDHPTRHDLLVGQSRQVSRAPRRPRRQILIRGFPFQPISPMKKSILFLAALFAAISSAQAQKLVVKGSDTLGAKLVPQLAEAYKAKNPGVTFEIAAEGSTTGIAAITDGTAQIGMSSRRAKPTEVSGAQAKGVTLKPTIVAFDGIAVIVNSSNPVAKL